MNRSILAIGAHPDDIEIGCGGTLAFFKEKGFEIEFAIITSGEQGAFTNTKTTKSIREEEALASAKYLGVRQVHFLHEPDGLFQYQMKTKLRLIEIIRTLKPSIAFIHTRADRFSDHKVVSELSVAALQGAAGPWYPEAGTAPHSVNQILGFEVWNPINDPQTFFDISGHVEEKLRLIQFHKSQIEQVNYSEAVRGLAQYRGAMSMTGKFAEAFEVIKTAIDSNGYK